MGSTYTLSYDRAKNYCRSDAAYLATPRSYYENKLLIWEFPNTNLWLGINDISKEGHFVSEDGHKVSYFRWGPGEPNDRGNEDGVHIVGNSDYGVKGKWNDSPITREFEFVCFRRI